MSLHVPKSSLPRVVIAGGGYVGFCTARALRARLGTDRVEIAIVDPRPYMTYQPFLPEVAAGSIQPRLGAGAQLNCLPLPISLP